MGDRQSGDREILITRAAAVRPTVFDQQRVFRGETNISPFIPHVKGDSERVRTELESASLFSPLVYRGKFIGRGSGYPVTETPTNLLQDRGLVVHQIVRNRRIYRYFQRVNQQTTLQFFTNKRTAHERNTFMLPVTPCPA